MFTAARLQVIALIAWLAARFPTRPEQVFRINDIRVAASRQRRHPVLAQECARSCGSASTHQQIFTSENREIPALEQPSRRGPQNADRRGAGREKDEP